MNMNLRLLYDYAMALVGVPYKWGGSNPISGFDCSGLVQELLAAVGMDPKGDQSAQTLHDYFFARGIRTSMGLGALAFYGKDVKSITHVVMMLDYVNAIGANGGGSKTVDLKSADSASAFVKIRPLDYRGDLVAVIMPDYGGMKA